MSALTVSPSQYALTVTENGLGIVSVGTQGPAGPAGAAGVGVPAGGGTTSVLGKNSATDYDTVWVNLFGAAHTWTADQTFSVTVVTPEVRHSSDNSFITFADGFLNLHANDEVTITGAVTGVTINPFLTTGTAIVSSVLTVGERINAPLISDEAITVELALASGVATVTGALAVTGALTVTGAITGSGSGLTGLPTQTAVQEFRLTTESGVPVSTSDRSSQSTLYLTPFKGNRIALYDGSAWQVRSSAEVSLALSGLTSGKNYDVFAYWTGSAVALELSAAWTSDSARADAVTRQDGVLVKSGTPTRRLVGTIRTTGTNTTADTGFTGGVGTGAKRFVWNLDNQTRRTMTTGFISDSHTDNDASNWREWHSGTNSVRLEWVCGDVGAIDLGVGVEVKDGGYGAVAVDAVTGAAVLNPQFGNASASLIRGGVATTKQVAAGYHFAAVMEFGSATPATLNSYSATGVILC